MIQVTGFEPAASCSQKKGPIPQCTHRIRRRIMEYPDLTKQDSAELQEYLAIHQNAQRDV